MTRGQTARLLVTALRKRHPERVSQWQKPGNTFMWDGATACFATCIQVTDWLWTGRFHTIDEIARLAGYPYHATGETGSPRGFRVEEARRAFVALGLPYKVLAGEEWATLALLMDTHGVVPYAMRYGSHPEKLGAVYAGQRAHAPFARESRNGGADQLVGFEEGRHEVLGLDVLTRADAAVTLRLAGPTSLPAGLYAAVLDVNHGSSARPGIPSLGYDIITNAQAREEYLDFAAITDGPTWAAVPQEQWDGRRAIERARAQGYAV